jgi:hypothetical protein
MKSSFSKHRKMPFLFGLFMLGVLLFTANRAEAQTYNWLQTDQAQQELATALDNLNSTMFNLQQGPDYQNALVKTYYYKEIRTRIVDSGLSVEQAVTSSLEILETNQPGVEGFSRVNVLHGVTIQLDKAKRDALFQDAVDLLTQ